MKSLVIAAAAFCVAACGNAATTDLGPVPRPNGQSEMAVRSAIEQDVRQALAHRDFERLNAMEEEYLASGERTPSGIHKLRIYHMWLEWILSAQIERANGCKRAQPEFTTDWEKAAPGNPAPVILDAYLATVEALCFRGRGYAATVPEDAWPKYNQLIEAARVQMLARHAELEKDPEFFAIMARILRHSGAGISMQRALLTAAVARHPYYAGIYSEAGQSFLPQWGGEPGDVEIFARFAADHTRAEGQAYYARVFWDLAECGCVALATDADWPRFRQGMRDAYGRYTTEHNAAFFAKMACLAGDGKEGRHFIRALFPPDTPDDALAVQFASCDRGDFTAPGKTS